MQKENSSRSAADHAAGLQSSLVGDTDECSYEDKTLMRKPDVDEEGRAAGRTYGAIVSKNDSTDQWRSERKHQPQAGTALDISVSDSDESSQYSSRIDYLTSEDRKAGNDAEHYCHQSMFARAYPERTLALFITLLLELPTLFIISGGSDKLCTLIGRRRYELLIAFLPLTSAISGNVGLQASTLTTRAISHLHVTKHSYCIWLLMEVGAAAYQGLGMGAVSGIFAFVASGQDFAFGFTIFLAQFFSIITAGFTGTMAPLVFTFLFQRDSGQWGGPLETAIQDIVGSFAMVVMSYHILTFFGPHEIPEWELC